MGSHSSKAPKGDVVGQQHPAEAGAGAASPSKANGQENGHVKINGDISPKADGEAAPLNGNGSAEPVKEEPKPEAGSGDAIEPAPVAEGAEAKAEATAAAGAPKETPKKKKKFSFKKSFKLSGISFRKTKKDAGDASAVASPSEEQGKAETQGEENPACAVAETESAGATKEEAPEEKAADPVDAAPAVEAPQEAEAPREEGSPGQGPSEEEKQQPVGDPEEERKPEETSKSGEAEPSPAAGLPEAKEE